ncbi:MAG: hypothetical protein JW817_00485 [Clostridiales bacterium]|nr:hypothetical protein [Clostridiales bacterium]
MKSTLKISSVLILSVLIIAGLAACGQKPVTAEEVTRAEAITDNLIEGIEKRDYAVFSKDFDLNMQEAMKEPNFIELADLFDETIGEYQSRTLIESRRILNAGTVLMPFTYQAKYDKDPGTVTITVYLTEKDAALLIAGFSYDSPTLQEKGLPEK